MFPFAVSPYSRKICIFDDDEQGPNPKAVNSPVLTENDIPTEKDTLFEDKTFVEKLRNMHLKAQAKNMTKVTNATVEKQTKKTNEDVTNTKVHIQNLLRPVNKAGKPLHIN